MKTVQFTHIEIFITKLYYINTFQAAAWTNTPKRREQKRIYTIVRSDISEAETTNNKRLRSTFCIEAIQTRSILLLIPVSFEAVARELPWDIGYEN